jgi:L-ribulose-5-phosphate 4-epimerase
MCEDVAKTIWIAKTMGKIKRIDQVSIDSLYSRYQNVYGQKGAKK